MQSLPEFFVWNSSDLVFQKGEKTPPLFCQVLLSLQTIQPPILVCVPASPKKSDFSVNLHNIKIKSN